MRVWLPSLLALTAISLAGFSWKILIFYTFFTLASLALMHVFLANNCEFEFDVVFKAFEWLGYGTPHCLESPSRLSQTLYTSPDGKNTNNLDQIPRPIARNLDKLIGNATRDFITSWYKDVGEGEAFVEETQRALEMLSVEAYKRACQLDAHYLIEQVILIFHAHLERFNKAGTVLEAKDPKLRLSISNSQLLYQTYESQIPAKHIAVSSPALELNYLRNVVDSLLVVLLPKSAFDCDMGRFILREILAVQAVDLITLLTDPNWVNEALIDLLCPPQLVSTETQLADQITYNHNTERKLGLNEIPEVTNDQHNTIDRSNEKRNISISNRNGTSDQNGEIEQVQLSNSAKWNSMNTEGNQARENSPEFSEQVFSLGTSPAHRGYSESFVVISTAEEKRNENTDRNRPGASSSLSSSWGVCPPPQDSRFLTDSFQAMRNQDTSQTKQGSKLSELGTGVKRLSSCCKTLEDSDEVDAPVIKNSGSLSTSGEFFHSIRSRSVSLSENLCGIGTKDNHMYTNHERKFQRSVSVPCIMSSISEISQAKEESQSRQSEAPAVEFYGSPFYNISFCSSEGSFKSFNNDEFTVEEGEEMDEDLRENADSDSSNIIDDVAPLPIMKPPKKAILNQPSFDADVLEQGSSVDSKYFPNQIFPSVEVTPDPVRTLSNTTQDSLDGVFQSPGISESSKDSSSSDAKSSIDRTSPSLFSQKSDSDSVTFSDSVINAGKKFISSIKSPVRTFGFSSTRSSTASTSTSSGFDSLEVNVPSSLERESSTDDNSSLSYERSLPRYTPTRKLSRSNAAIDMSSESDSELFGTPEVHTPIREEIVYGIPASDCKPGEVPINNMKGVVKIHPSQLITIPETEMALESALEPGRNKFTLYKIEYDVRIWPNVYKAMLEGAYEENQGTTLKALQSSRDTCPDESKSSIEGSGIPVKRVCKRRYREFMELNNRLSSGPLAAYMKDVLKPNRKYNLPFGRLDRQVVEGRRQILQYYLVSLVSKPELRNSVDLQQFLGVISGDVSFIKPSVAQIINQSVHVPRVDKMLGRQMTKVFDSIKTAFDSDGPENSENVYSPPPDDIDCPWKLVCQDDDMSNNLEDKENLFPPEECFDTFLDKLKDGSPLSPLPWHHISHDDAEDTDGSFFSNQLSVSPWRYPSLHDDYSSDDEIMMHHLGPRTAADGSDTPDELSSVSHASSDDMLFGALGTRPPEVCLPPSISLSASTGCLADFDARDRKVSPHWSTPKKPLGPSLSMPSCAMNSADSEDGRFKSHHLPFSKKSLEKLKHAADQVKQKKGESVENIQAAKQKVKALKDEKLKHAAEEMKQKKHESLEGIHATKEKMKAFKTEKFKQAAMQVKHRKKESSDNLQAAKEKVKSLNVDKLKQAAEHAKQKKAESMGNIHAAKEKMKAMNVEKFRQVAEQVNEKRHESADNIHAAKEKMKAMNVEKFKQVAEQVNEKRHESADNIHAAREKLMAMKDEKLKQASAQVKQRKHESMENIHAAKEKAKSFKKTLPNPKIIVKEHTAGETHKSTESMRQPDGAELRHRRRPLGMVDEPLVMSGYDAPSKEITTAMTDVQPGDTQCPLSDAILNLTCEILKSRDSWASLERVQQAFAGVFGGFFEWFLQREIDDLFTEDCWGLYLNNLDDVIWPGGQLRDEAEPKSEEEKAKTKKLAVETLMKFFPDFFSLLVGSKLYKECADNAVESLQNTSINRTLIYMLLETFLGEFIPELQSKIYTD